MSVSVDAPCAGASDATYHIMWIVIFNALDDFGIREVNDMVRTGSPGNEHPNYAQIEGIKKKVSDDALHGALRIAGLVSRSDFSVVSSSGTDSWYAGWRVDHQWLSGMLPPYMM